MIIFNSVYYLLFILSAIIISSNKFIKTHDKNRILVTNLIGVAGGAFIILNNQYIFSFAMGFIIICEGFINDKGSKKYYIKMILITLIVLIAEIIYKYRVWPSYPKQFQYTNEVDLYISKILYIIFCVISLSYAKKSLPFKNKNLIYLLLVLNLIIAI